MKYARKANATKGVLYRINVEQDIDEEVAKTVEQRLRELMPKNKCVKETLETLPSMAQEPLFKKNDDADANRIAVCCAQIPLRCATGIADRSSCYTSGACRV